jgi:tetratricopeptide (TPR) repeat protein
MKTTRFFYTLLISLFSLLVSDQGKDVKPISPDILRKGKEITATIERGDSFLFAKDFESAVLEYRKAMEIEATLPGGASSGAYQLAKAFAIMGNHKSALDAFAVAVKFDHRRKDWAVRGPSTIQVAMDFAICAAQVGDVKKAKEMYYFGLRNFNTQLDPSVEPIPFIVVFDPDPTMECWEYSKESLIAAAKMVKAVYTDTAVLIAEVHALKPDWLLPYLFEASGRTGKAREGLVLEASKNAKTDRERGLIRAYVEKTIPLDTGLMLRKNSIVLKNSKPL